MSLMLSGVTLRAGLAVVIAVSAAARLAAPQFYAGLAHDACPNGLAEGLIRLSGATLIPIAAALWTLKVVLFAKTLRSELSIELLLQIPTVSMQQGDHESCNRMKAWGWPVA